MSLAHQGEEVEEEIAFLPPPLLGCRIGKGAGAVKPAAPQEARRPWFGL
jgi:hypothetical protein